MIVGGNNAPTRSRSVLLVEDNDDHAELVRRALRLSGLPHQLSRCEDGEQALQLLLGSERQPRARSDCDLVLLDLRLPGVGGIEVLRALRASDRRMVPTVVLTTSEADADIRAAYESGARAYLVKPADFASFGDLVHDLARFWLVWNETVR